MDSNSVAERCGLMVGDRIWSVSGVDVHRCDRIQCLALLQQPILNTTLIVTRWCGYHLVICIKYRYNTCTPNKIILSIIF